MPVEAAEVLAWRLRGALGRAAHAGRMRLIHRRPFSGRAERRLLLLSIDQRIPQSQIHPFHVHAAAIRARHGTELREVPLCDYLSARHRGLDGATTVAFQSDFDLSPAAFETLRDTLRVRSPQARLVYLDWSAPTDLRLAKMLDPYLSVYVKKHALADLSRYGLPTRGDTNLTDHYSRRFGLGLPETTYPVPPGFLSRLVIGPSFVTADFLRPAFLRDAPPGGPDRPIDLHARLAVDGTDWYRAMRSDCVAAAARLRHVRVVTGTGIGLARYMQELRAAKIVFSPFGYGEVCWRDFEAVASGAVLLKPDMSHVRTEPDIFVAGETYMPVRWDLADFEDTVHRLLGDPGLRERLTRQAFAVLRDYVRSGRFVDQMAPVFG